MWTDRRVVPMAGWRTAVLVLFCSLLPCLAEEKPAQDKSRPIGQMLDQAAGGDQPEPLQADRMSEADLRQLQKDLKLSDEDFRVFREQMRREEQRAREERRARREAAQKATHEQTAVIGSKHGPGDERVHNFCLHPDGRLLVCGGGTRVSYVMEGGQMRSKTVQDAAAIRVLNAEGQELATWPLAFTPQAICAGRNGTVFVGGDGKLARLDAQGRVLQTSDAPGILIEQRKKADAEKIASVDDEPGRREQESKREKPQAESSVSLLEAFFDGLSGGALSRQRAQNATEEDEHMKRRIRAITGLAATEDDLFVAAPGRSGYAVYRVAHDFQQPKRIVDRLSGCCGQMDIQALGADLIVAESGRHRVSRYDRDGKPILHWGRTDRREEEGFGGCCNPKNVRVVGEAIYTAESGPERIKRHAVDGKLLDLVALPELGGGCMRITVEATADGSRVYVLNSGTGAIHVLSRKAQTGKGKEGIGD